jgi:GT2 family glycosyltransferase
MKPTSILVVTVNWNSGEKLKDCIKSFIATSKPCVINLIVVDNCSEDGSEKFLEDMQKQHDCLSLVRSSKNIGFGNGCNLGVETAKIKGIDYEFIIFLNPDTRLYENSFELLFNSPSIEDKSIGIFGVQIFDDNGLTYSCSYFPTALNFWCKILGLNRFIYGVKSIYHHMRDFDHLCSREVDQVMGSFLMIRDSLFSDLNGFDTQFFVYFEEVDLCYRAKKNGYKVWFESNSKIWHYGGGTTEKVEGYRLYLSISSRIRYFFKNSSCKTTMSILLLSFPVELLVRALRSVLIFDLKGLKEVLRCYLLFFRRGIK